MVTRQRRWVPAFAGMTVVWATRVLAGLRSGT
ncbi:hypothetical protein HNQ52_000584 [Chiayiivirga flava]|uniref:Uncharacterized protein n=1 Tax=Chiayiivirga flava TaxID=659595 RepID=A0A7W8FZW3_9GAMM|nr:hypothetical protein [Chiayiivirga flava]